MMNESHTSELDFAASYLRFGVGTICMSVGLEHYASVIVGNNRHWKAQGNYAGIIVLLISENNRL